MQENHKQKAANRTSGPVIDPPSEEELRRFTCVACQEKCKKKSSKKKYVSKQKMYLQKAQKHMQRAQELMLESQLHFGAPDKKFFERNYDQETIDLIFEHRKG